MSSELSEEGTSLVIGQVQQNLHENEIYLAEEESPATRNPPILHCV